jgi:hypothetical protein
MLDILEIIWMKSSYADKVNSKLSSDLFQTEINVGIMRLRRLI